MQYTGERVIPPHNGNILEQGNYAYHIAVYRDFLENGIVSNKEVIDVACGCGHGSRMIAEKGAKSVRAYDISPEAIEFAKTHYAHPSISYQVQDICLLPDATGSADCVISVEVFEHVAQVERMISEVHRVLRPRGFWLLTTPNGVRYPDHKIVPWHVKHYNKDDLNNLLSDGFNIYIKEVGLEPDSSQYRGWPVFSNYAVYCMKKS